MKKQLSLVLASSALLIGCSTITTGTTQSLTVKTPYANGAECSLVDTKDATWRVSQTPQTLEVTKGNGPMTITCKKSGFKTTSYVMKEHFAGATLGNFLIGGPVGVVVDAASGAAQEYPSEISIWMEPVKFATAQDKADWNAEKMAYEESLKPKVPQNNNENAVKSTSNINTK